MFGGANSTGYINNIYMMQPNVAAPNWTLIDTDNNPGQRNGHTATEIDGMIYVFGGWDQTKYYNDLWALDTSGLLNGTRAAYWREFAFTPAPAPRDGHTGVDYQGDLVIFGGFSHNTQNGNNSWTDCSKSSDKCIYYNDLWFFNTPTSSWKKMNPSGTLPAARHMHSADVVGDRMLVFGGTSAQGDLNDLWSYQFSRNEWTQLKPSGVLPTPRHSHIAGVIGGILYIYGGNTGTQDTWQFTLNVEQKYDTVDQVNLDPLTGAAVFNVLVIFAIAVVVFFTYKHIRGGGSSASEKSAINDIE
jgi:N-acetylneuraminic acid mutarotase